MKRFLLLCGAALLGACATPDAEPPRLSPAPSSPSVPEAPAEMSDGSTPMDSERIADETGALAYGRELTARLLTGETDPLYGRMSEELQMLVGSVEALRAFSREARASLGDSAEPLNERGLWGPRYFGYIADYPGAQGVTMRVQWDFDGDGAILGMLVQPNEAPPSPYSEHQTRAALRLPFDGEWTVVWGGRTVSDNYHAVVPQQRFALDVLVVRDGRSHINDGQQLSDYHCWGMPIVSPGDGTVVAVHDGEPDQPIGQQDPSKPAGNHVLIDHGTGEYSLLAHLQNGSVAPEVGQAVRGGQPLGLCGNSGNTTEPHLHYHLQDSPDPTAGEGMPAQFVSYLADGEQVDRGELSRGERVEHIR